jgi:PmbA protein
MKEKLIRKISAAFKYWELYSLRKEKRPIQFVGGACSMIKESTSEGFAIRVIDKGKIGFYASTILEDVDKVVALLKANLMYGKNAQFEFVRNYTNTYSIKTYDTAIEKLSNEKMIALGSEVVKKIADYNSDIDVNFTLEAQMCDIDIMNSSGLELHEQKSLLSSSLEATLSNDDDILTIYKDKASGNLDLSIFESASECVQLFEHSKKRVTLPRNLGEIPVIFHPDAMEVLLLPLLHAFNGQNLSMGTSPLMNKENSREFSPALTIIESPRVDYATFSRNFDDEGAPIREKYLVRNGIINEFMFDLSNAQRLHKVMNGNGFRSNASSPNIFMEPTINHTGLVVSEGTVSNENMIKNTKQGIIIYSLLGVGQGNIINGDFSNNVELGFYIENGEIVGRIKDVMIAGNAFECLERIDCISSKRLHEKESLSVPYMQFSNIRLVS